MGRTPKARPASGVPLGPCKSHAADGRSDEVRVVIHRPPVCHLRITSAAYLHVRGAIGLSCRAVTELLTQDGEPDARTTSFLYPEARIHCRRGSHIVGCHNACLWRQRAAKNSR